MYGFKLANGQRVSRAQFDGYIVGDIALVDIMIQVEFDEKNQIKTFFTAEDAIKIKAMNSHPWLKEAQDICQKAIEAKDYRFLLCQSPIIDILNEHNQSYHQKNIHHSRPFLQHKEVVKLNIQPIFANAFLAR